jgi:hypothetical protein
MNVLWVEDFGGLGSNAIAFIRAIFKELLGENAIDSHLDPDLILDIKRNPDYFSEFCKEHSDHKVTLIANHYDFDEYAKKEDFSLNFDIVIIDINLSEGVNVEKPLPKEFEDVQDFHSKAGFYVFNRLNSIGFGQQQTCFLTGELDIPEFNNQCKAILFSPPNSYTKNTHGYNGVRKFINKISSDPFISIRRFIISSVQELLSDRNKVFSEPFGRDLDKENFLNNLLWNARQLSDKKNYHQFHLNICDYLTKPFERFTLDVLLENEFEGKEPPFKKRCNYIPLYFLRNWISHGLLQSTKLENQDTYFVFCLTLSCLFGEFWTSDNQEQKYPGFRFPNIANKISKKLFPHSEQEDIEWSKVLWEILGKLHIKKNGPEFLWAIKNKGHKKKNKEWTEENYRLLFYASFLISNTNHHWVEKTSGLYQNSVSLVNRYVINEHPLNCIAYSAIRQLEVKL